MAAESTQHLSLVLWIGGVRWISDQIRSIIYKIHIDNLKIHVNLICTVNFRHIGCSKYKELHWTSSAQYVDRHSFRHIVDFVQINILISKNPKSIWVEMGFKLKCGKQTDRYLTINTSFLPLDKNNKKRSFVLCT